MNIAKNLGTSFEEQLRTAASGLRRTTEENLYYIPIAFRERGKAVRTCTHSKNGMIVMSSNFKN